MSERERGTDDARDAKLRELLGDLPSTPSGVRSRADWKQRVLAATAVAELAQGELDEPRPRVAGRRTRRAVAVALVAVAAAAAVLLAVFPRTGAPSPAAPRVDLEVVAATRPHRGAEYSVGDTLIVKGFAAGAGELRVYNAMGVEQARCAEVSPACAIERDGDLTTLRLTLPLREPGVLRAVVFAAALGSTNGADGDLVAARRAGIAQAVRELEIR